MFVKSFAALVLLLLASAAHTGTDRQLRLDPLLIATLEQQSPAQFAAALPLALDATHEGNWTLQGETLHWQHGIVVEGAKALALEAETLNLPADAVLHIGDETWRGPLKLGALFTRHQPGTRLQLRAWLPRAAVADFMLRVVAVQAAYRDPGAGETAVKAADRCTLNFACAAEGAVQQWGGAVVALTVLNTVSCTGTLMNNTAGDGRPYLLTARHCYSSTGSTDPVRAAASLRMAWNAVAPCGTALASAWGSATAVTQGARHRAEYGDSWLVELDTRPPDSVGPWYAGFDAGDQPPMGAVTGIHNGAALQRQLLSSTAAPRSTRIAAFSGGIDLLAWGFSPQRGAAAAGASGSGLFDAEGRVIGTLSTGLGCAADIPLVSYARLAQAWSGNGSSAASLKPWLDPLGIGSSLTGKSFVSADLPPTTPSAASAPAVLTPRDSSSASSGGALDLWGLLCLMAVALWRRRVQQQAFSP